MSDEARDLLVRGIAAAKAEYKDEARFYLEWVLRTDSDQEQKIKAWHWLSKVSDDQGEIRDCLENILAYDPYNVQARRSLAILDGRLDPAQIIDTTHQPAPMTAAPQPSTAKRFVCSKCGGKLAFCPDQKTLMCRYCHRKLSLNQAIEEGSMVEEQDFAVALATAKGHTRPVAMQSFQCQACSASFLPGPNVLSLNCPYCGSAYVIRVSESRHIIPAEGIIPFAISQVEAAQAHEAWLVQRHLRHFVQTTLPQGLYFPVWTFDVGGAIQWRGQTSENEYGGVGFATTTGSYPVFFDDLLVPASHTIPGDLACVIHDFRLGDLVSYDPAYTVDWPAELYQVTAAEASLVARRKAWLRARQMIADRAPVEMAHVNDLYLSSAGIIIEAFKLILLPIWIASYHYQGTDYDTLINGQTGNVRGKTPAVGIRGWLQNIFR